VFLTSSLNALLFPYFDFIIDWTNLIIKLLIIYNNYLQIVLNS
jgi:hypothetical protein